MATSALPPVVDADTWLRACSAMSFEFAAIAHNYRKPPTLEHAEPDTSSRGGDAEIRDHTLHVTPALPTIRDQLTLKFAIKNHCGGISYSQQGITAGIRQPASHHTPSAPSDTASSVRVGLQKINGNWLIDAFDPV
jgi:hypothetical protein